MNGLIIYFYSITLTGRGGTETVLKTIDPLLMDANHEARYLFPTPATADPTWDQSIRERVVYTQRTLHDMVPRVEQSNPLFEMILDLQATLKTLPKPDVIIGMSPLMLVVAKLSMSVYDGRPPLLVSWMHASLHVIPDLNLLGYADAHLAISTGIYHQLKKTLKININQLITIHN